MEATATEPRIHIEGEGPWQIAKARYTLEAHLIRCAFRAGLTRLGWRHDAA